MNIALANNEGAGVDREGGRRRGVENAIIASRLGNFHGLKNCNR